MGMKESGDIRKKEKNLMEMERDERKMGEGSQRQRRPGWVFLLVLLLLQNVCWADSSATGTETHTHTHTWLSPWYKCTEHNGGAVFLVSKRKQCGQRTNDRVREKVGVVYRSTCVREHRGTAVPDSLEKSAFIKLLRRCSEKITHTHVLI